MLCLILAAGLPGGASADETISYRYDGLGRLVEARSTGSVNNDVVRSACYDPAGNREIYKVNSTGIAAACDAPVNKPPAVSPDTISLPRCGVGWKNLVANDSDPEGNEPLALTGIGNLDYFGPDVQIVSATTVAVEASSQSGVYNVSYTVSDSLGAESNSTLTINVGGGSGC